MRSLLAGAPFIAGLGVELVTMGSDGVETVLAIEPRHSQQNGFVHAGVIGAMADHTAGGAAFAHMPPGAAVLTVEYKLNLLRPARGERLRCRAEPVKIGRTISVVDSRVYACTGDREELVATATVTLATVPLAE